MKWARRILAAALVICSARLAQALEPADIVVLYNTNSQPSLEVARYYMNARQIPRENLVPITCAVQEFIPQKIYQDAVVPQLRKELDRLGMTDKVKCLVPVLDIPLRVEPVVLSAQSQVEVKAYQDWLKDLTKQIAARQAEYNAIAPDPMSVAPSTQSIKDDTDWKTAASNLSNAANAAAHRIALLSAKEQEAALAQIVPLQKKSGGLMAVISSLHVRPESPDAEIAQKDLTDMQTRLADIEREFAVLKTQMDSPAAREKMIALRTESHGLVGGAEMIDEILQYLNPPETEASLDNELALALADQNYPRARWIPNPCNVEFYPVIRRLRNVPRTIMVCRVDGSTVARTEEMIRTTLVVEKKGLEGKIYLDARGLRTTDGYGAFDANIRAAADWLRSNSTIEVVLDDHEALFQAKDCPDCALYCGWYSVHKYHDSCQWLPGAVGYHVASYELTSLHIPGEPGWVVNLLDRGFCGTLGPVSEPYLHSFPKPSLFFPLLLSGEFTQGEVWQLTTPLLSWRQAYVGDPLYNPFKAHPKVKIEALKSDTILRNAFEILR